MTQEEIVRLASRALACIQFISAADVASYLPTHFLWLHHYLQLQAASKTVSSIDVPYEQLTIACSFGRVAFFLLLGYVFWSCGPRIARLLVPGSKSATASAE
jgi:hypothetical protein